MKYYNPKLIKQFIDEHKDTVATVSVGMEEDWFWTAETIFEDGETSTDLSGDSLRVAGITGSTWATPVMRVEFKDGTEQVIPCYEDDLRQADPQKVAYQKAFCATTGGMDSVYEQGGGK